MANSITRLFDIYRKLLSKSPKHLTSGDIEELLALLEQVIRINQPALLATIQGEGAKFHLVLSTDGGCRPNPGTGTYAFVITGFPEELKAVEIVPGGQTTNNRAEIYGILRGLEYLVPYKHKIKTLKVNCDSKVALFGAGKIWKRSSNTDLFMEIDKVLDLLGFAHHKIKWEWLPRNSTPALSECHKMGERLHKEWE